MVDRVFLHIGLPKTATTYLQTIVWSNRARLRKDGVLLPGRERRDHLWSSRIIRDDFGRRKSLPPEQATAWDRLRDELASWHGTGLISHEFFAAADPEQAQRMVADLAPAQVELIITAREPLGLFTASWQESLKNRATARMRDYSTTVSDRPSHIWNWRTLDLRLVLERWSQAVPHERIHVLPLDRTSPRDEIWRRFAGVIGVAADSYDLSGSFPNESMGVVEAELLRRINERLEARDLLTTGFERGVFIRTFLADERLVPRHGDRFWPDEGRIEECRQRAGEICDYLTQHPIDLVGNLDDLRVPDPLEDRRIADQVSDSELVAVATDLIAVLLEDVRTTRATADGATSGWWRRITRSFDRRPAHRRRNPRSR